MANGAELPQQLIISNNVNENKGFHKVLYISENRKAVIFV